MTPQEIFDTVAKHLFAQGRRATIRETDIYGEVSAACRYRAEDGTKCAVGALIPDEVYDPKMEGYDVDCVLSSDPGYLPEWMHDNAELLRALQTAHDAESSWVTTEAMRGPPCRHCYVA